jgi:ceramide glucosyltransferase
LVIISWIGVVFIAAAITGAIYAAVATWTVRLFVRREDLPAATFPSISLMKPLHGDEPGLYDNLQSFCVQDYPGAVQIIFGVQDPADPAVAVVQRLRDAYPQVDIILTLGATGEGGNRKIANMTTMGTRATGDIIVMSDSDVRVEPDHLRRVVATLQQPGVGLATCLYRAKPTASIWSALAALDIDYRFSPSVVMGLHFGLAYPCLGPTMALKRTLFEEIGGFPYLSNFLADDYELGRAVRRRGLKVAFPRGLIDHLCPEASLREMLVHEFRWARTVRMIEPAGYFGSGITHFLMLALLGSALTGFSGWSLIVLALVAALRVVLVLRLSDDLSASRRGLWLLPLRDALSFAVFVAAFFGDQVEWRGVRLKVGPGGQITLC